MAREKLPVDIENFEEIRKEVIYHADKTGLNNMKVLSIADPRFCDAVVYCPWDVVNYIDLLCHALRQNRRLSGSTS